MELLLSVVFSIVVIGFPVLAITMNFLAHQEIGRSHSGMSEFESEHHPFTAGNAQREILHTQAQG